MKPNLVVAASGRVYVDPPPFFDDLDDLEAWMIRVHNEIRVERRATYARTHCPDPRCQKLAHPDHANGHLMLGVPQDPKDRADSTRGMR